MPGNPELEPWNPRTSNRTLENLPNRSNPHEPCLTEHMHINDWLAAAKADAIKRRMPELIPLLESLAASTTALRNADAEDRAAPPAEPPKEHP